MLYDGKIWVGTGEVPVCLLPQMANRHGLIAGATGTGKTVSLKVLAEGGRYKYATVERAEKGMSDRFIRILSESILSVESAGNLIVIKTITASANAGCEAIDSMKWPEVLGTIAGDNTILIIARSEAAVDTLLQKFDNLIKK